MFHFHRKRDILAEVIWTALSVILIVSLVAVLLRNEPLPPIFAFVLVALLIVGAVDGARVRSWVRIKHDHPAIDRVDNGSEVDCVASRHRKGRGAWFPPCWRCSSPAVPSA